MTTDEARRTFAALMKLARERELTEKERARLTKARQLLRRRSRPAMNRPRGSKHRCEHCGARVPTVRVSSPSFKKPRQLCKACIARAGYRVNRAPRLGEAVDERLQQMHHMFTSGHGHDTGKLIYRGGYGPGSRDVVGRIGGVKPSFPELRHESASPQAIAKAITRGRGKVYDRVRDAVERGLRPGLDYVEGRPSSRGRPTVAPHKKIRRYCVHCRAMHTKGEHRFRGTGSFHRTHLFSFNKPRRRQRVGRIVEIRYERDWGRRPGFYKHVFRVPAALYRMPDGSILIE